MTPDQLRDLANRLEPMAAAPGFDGLDVPAFVAWLRQCAEQRPVAYKHTEPDGSVAYFGADEAPCEKCTPLFAAPLPPTEAQREPLLKLLELADLSDGSQYGTLSTSAVRDLVNEALGRQHE